jgi:hypothetical protein
MFDLLASFYSNSSGVARFHSLLLLNVTILAFGSSNVRDASAEGNDLTLLGQNLAPAYTAMNYDSLCGMWSGWYSIEPRGPRGSAPFYAQDAKNEAIRSLSDDDALTVLRIAADAARAEARKQLTENVIADSKIAEDARLTRWCQGYALDFIRRFISKFEVDHRAPEGEKEATGTSPISNLNDPGQPRGWRSW